MNWLDVLIIIALGTSVAIGVLRGFVRECFSLASYVIGYLTASGTYSFFAAHLGGLIKNPQVRIVLCFGIVFIMAVIVVNLAGRLLRKLISKAKGLSMVDRTVGLIFGFCRGVLILSLIMIPISLFPVLGSDSIRNSYLAPSLKIVSRELAAWAFSEKNIVNSPGIKNSVDFLKEKVDGGIDSLKKAAGAGKAGKDASGISQKDREKLNQLLEKL